MESVHITEIKVDKSRVDIYYKLSDGIKKYFLPDSHFFAEYDFDISNVPKSILVVPILLNLLQFSWITNSVIWVDEIDEDFYNCIQPLKTAFKELHPNMNLQGTLIAARIVKNEVKNKETALQLFTGGVDATTTLIRNIDKSPILFNTNGWYQRDPSEVNKVYDADVEAIANIAKSYNLDANFVKSNFANFIIHKNINNDFCSEHKTTWWFGFQHSMAFLGCAMVAAYAIGINTVYIASSYTFGQYVVCVSIPPIDNCVKCAGIKTVHDSYELSRQEKVKEIVKFQKETNHDVYLRVCSFNEDNCCKCEKCFRTMLSLVVEGVDDLAKYGFNLDDTLLNSLKQFILKSAMELDRNHIVFWNDLINMMKNNYDMIAYKDVCDYLMSVDLEKARKDSIYLHYRKDYKDIIKRKLFRR